MRRASSGAAEIASIAGVLGAAIVNHAPNPVVYALTTTLAWTVWWFTAGRKTDEA
jgi:hypothetical protein